mmetsp:Transcript_6233/g.13475  ORF Transcript_6233/g.13475 Transcript_6233/m.13475 type:complete len:763 (-) Transcript_6233:550-2838(-)
MSNKEKITSSSAISLIDEAITQLSSQVEKIPMMRKSSATEAETTTLVSASSQAEGLKKDPPAAHGHASNFDRWNETTAPIRYGPFSSSFATGSAVDRKPFYLTTAINYTNGPAHMGHAYEAVTSDILARAARLSGHLALFVTGSDEHGQKIAGSAEDAGVPPINICDKYVAGFRVLNQRCLISNDDYIRTTSERHARTARALWDRCAKAGDIYLGSYEGWYNVREETFVTDKDAQATDYKDPASGLPLRKVSESSYFFKMGSYHERLVEHIRQNPNFIQPEHQRKFVLSRLDGDPLRDLSISRTTFNWGIGVEGDPPGHVMYVWFDALSNYLTGCDVLGVNDDEKTKGRGNHWPADVHVIGKDIIWFHAVIWPCILMSAGLDLPKTIFAHGFVNDKEGKKMSKSLGNVVDPHDMLDQFSIDTFRWYLAKEAIFGSELSFKEESLQDMHNADLCDTLGNLVHRATKLCEKYCGGAVPDVPLEQPLPINFADIRKKYLDKISTFEIEGAAADTIAAYRDVNGYLTTREPWKMKGDDRADERRAVVRTVLESVYALSHLLGPFVPNGAHAIAEEKLHTPLRENVWEVEAALNNLKPGTVVTVGNVLYKKIVSKDEMDTVKVVSGRAEEYRESQRKKKEAKAKMAEKSKMGQAKKATSVAAANQPEFSKMDIRVGKIGKVWNHPDADRLYCEEIDVGKDSGGIREIASGLRGHYEISDLKDRKVLVVCNLKASKILGFISNGMVLAAKVILFVWLINFVHHPYFFL